MNKIKLYLLCGLPGSGKTTYAKKLQQKTGAVILSIDDIMTKLFKFKTKGEFQKRYKDTEKIIFNKTKALICDGKSVILDFGFWKKSDRKTIIEKGKSWGADVTTYYFKIDLTTLHKRLDTRNKYLPINTPLIVTHKFLDNFAKQFESPTKSETKSVIIK